MTETTRITADVLARLASLQDAGHLSAKAQAGCDALIDRLRAPVRIGIFGYPGTGKRAVMTALAGDMTAPLPADLPTTELCHGDQPATQAMLADGATLDLEGPPTPDLLEQAPVFLGISDPSPALIGRQLLLVATDASAGDFRAALAWAAGRVDIALFCTHGWTGSERAAWAAAPDSLRDHALLLRTAGPAHGTVPAAFEAAFDVANGPEGPDPAGVTRLLAHLDHTIEEAAMQAVHLAQMFLQRHAPPPQPAASGAPVSADILPHPAMQVRPAAMQPPCPEATNDLARLFQSLRQSAAELHAALRRGDLDAAEPDVLLDGFETLFARLADRLADMDRVQEAWPALDSQLTEARDLALLLRIEGGTEQVTDAARLLLQIRAEIETRLAA